MATFRKSKYNDVNIILMEDSTGDIKKHKKSGKKVSLGEDFTEDEDHMMLKEEEKEKARKRTRGPYRKSSRVGL